MRALYRVFTLSELSAGLGYTTRYWGLAKTHVQHVAIAAAINIDRLVAWLDERPRALTRLSRFAALAPANAYHPGEAAA